MFFISIFVIAEFEKNLFNSPLCGKDTTAKPRFSKFKAVFHYVFSRFLNLRNPSIVWETCNDRGTTGAAKRNFGLFAKTPRFLDLLNPLKFLDC